MFVVVRGEVVVTLEPGDREVARIGPGGFFGEMSLLTGAPRTATVRTTDDSELLEITADAFRRFVLANPTAVEQVGDGGRQRGASNSISTAPPDARRRRADAGKNLVDRVRRLFLGASMRLTDRSPRCHRSGHAAAVGIARGFATGWDR